MLFGVCGPPCLGRRPARYGRGRRRPCTPLQSRFPQVPRPAIRSQFCTVRQSPIRRAVGRLRNGGTTAAASGVMPKDSRGHAHDPMAREVDRLLAQLSRTGRPDPAPAPSSSTAARRRITRVASASAISPAERAGLWARLALGATLGGLMPQWPHPHGCGAPLAGYLAAVTMVMVAGVCGRRPCPGGSETPPHMSSPSSCCCGASGSRQSGCCRGRGMRRRGRAGSAPPPCFRPPDRPPDSGLPIPFANPARSCPRTLPAPPAVPVAVHSELPDLQSVRTENLGVLHCAPPVQGVPSVVPRPP